MRSAAILTLSYRRVNNQFASCGPPGSVFHFLRRASGEIPSHRASGISPGVMRPFSNGARDMVGRVRVFGAHNFLQMASSMVIRTLAAMVHLAHPTFTTFTLCSIEPEFVGGVVKGKNVLRWDACLDVVDVVEHVSAAGLPDLPCCAARASRTVSGDADGSTCCASIAPPQNTNRSPKRSFRSSLDPCPAALICTGFRMSTPLSKRSGMYSARTTHTCDTRSSPASATGCTGPVACGAA